MLYVLKVRLSSGYTCLCVDIYVCVCASVLARIEGDISANSVAAFNPRADASHHSHWWRIRGTVVCGNAPRPLDRNVAQFWVRCFFVDLKLFIRESMLSILINCE